MSMSTPIITSTISSTISESALISNTDIVYARIPG
jgi:hypothetical protein